MKKNPRWSARKSAVWTWTVVVALLLSTSSANAHILNGEPVSFRSGFMHPLSGWDHIIAMVAVGIWGAQLGAPAIWVLPVTFPMIMSFGGFLGLIKVPLPGGEKFVEFGIALSGVILGAMVLREARPKIWIAAATVGLFGLCHGYAHGYELPDKESGLYYSVGFVIATGLLHLCGIVIGLVHHWPQGRIALRVCGAAIMLGGLYFLYQAFLPEAPETPAPASNAAKTAALPHSTLSHHGILS
ncbi:MAG TPA: HupE/UreJ family protein [Opitutales bacterium]|jgi:urease accessory protein|nr:HupE/UreJ family protein [Opitutales bacterium]